MKLPKTIRHASLLLAMGSLAHAAPAGWTEDFEAAKKQAAAENKDLLLNFTGSDWCGWCIKLKEEVFQKEAFKDGVKEAFVLVEVDFPQDESKLTEEVKRQNERLQETYPVEGYPTLVLTDAAGVPYGTTGYQPGGAEKYVAHLEELRASKTEREKQRERAKDLEGAEKAEALAASLEGLPEEMVTAFYPEVLTEIQQADPENAFARRIADGAKYAEFENEIRDLFMAGDLKAAGEKIEQALSEKRFEGEYEQQVILIKVNILLAQENFDGAVQAIDEAAAAAPDSPLAQQAEDFKAQIEQMRQQHAAEEE